MTTTYKNCQSCGMPLKRDPQGGGTNVDGSISTKYCSYCYKAGAFKNPDFTVKQMQELCTEKLKEKGFPKFLARLFTANIPRLERWKKT